MDEFAHHCALSIGQIEPTIQEAFKSDYSREWKKAAEDENKSLMKTKPGSSLNYQKDKNVLTANTSFVLNMINMEKLTNLKIVW